MADTLTDREIIASMAADIAFDGVPRAELADSTGPFPDFKIRAIDHYLNQGGTRRGRTLDAVAADVLDAVYTADRTTYEIRPDSARWTRTVHVVNLYELAMWVRFEFVCTTNYSEDDVTVQLGVTDTGESGAAQVKHAVDGEVLTTYTVEAHGEVVVVVDDVAHVFH